MNARALAKRPILAASAAGLVLVAAAGLAALWTMPVRGATRAYSQLMAAVNAGDLEGVRRLCSARYLASHTPELAAEGGVIGFPRNIHKNFKAWTQGPVVWLCPTNSRYGGPIYEFVREGGSWRFAGPIGLLDSTGRVLPMDDLTEPGGRAMPARD